MGHLSPSVREGLQDSITILRGVQQAAGSKGLSASAAFAQPSGLARKLLGLAAVGASSAAAHAAGISAELPLTAAWFAKEMLSGGAEVPAREAVRDFITSPAGRIALEAAASGSAIPQGKLALMAASAPVQGLMKVMGIPASDSVRWLSRAITTGAVQTATQPGLKEQAQ